VSTAITVLATALASGLVMAVFAVSAQTREAFVGVPVGYDAVLGARGSPLQLVLNTVFHLETSPGNIPWERYEEVRDDPRVELAVPYAVGDSYRGFRVVGTSEAIFTALQADGTPTLQVATGRTFDPAAREAVIGSTVARRAGLSYGDEFHPSHGLVSRGGDDHGDHHDEEYVVVGVLAPTNSPSDRVIWIPIEGMFRMGGHVLRGAGAGYTASPGDPIPDEHKEVSAVMLKLRGPQAGFSLDAEVNREGKDATLAWPIARSVAELFDKLGWVNRVLELVAYLVVVVAAGSILASLYNTMNERRREFAILRALGARRRTVFAVIVMEATVIAALGSLLGYAVYFGILGGASLVIREQSGVVLDLLAFHPALVWMPLGMVVLGALAGLLPARKAYATDVASHLVPGS
jgi:putative ABC transport system permease protein